MNIMTYDNINVSFYEYNDTKIKMYNIIKKNVITNINTYNFLKYDNVYKNIFIDWLNWYILEKYNKLQEFINIIKYRDNNVLPRFKYVNDFGINWIKNIWFDIGKNKMEQLDKHNINFY